jgi:hypothetical protein
MSTSACRMWPDLLSFVDFILLLVLIYVLPKHGKFVSVKRSDFCCDRFKL